MNIFERIGHKIVNGFKSARIGIKKSLGSSTRIGKFIGNVSDYGKYIIPIAGLMNPVLGRTLGGVVAGASIVSKEMF
tara:strand:- start:701 stop:931 length:231 start_codon:yes stop_codon:yes gene_type:complete